MTNRRLAFDLVKVLVVWPLAGWMLRPHGTTAAVPPPPLVPPSSHGRSADG